MELTAARGEADELARFRRLLNATILATFARLRIGEWFGQRLGSCGAAGSGRGLALCGGRALPFPQQNAVTESVAARRRRSWSC
jgi:hypothetical protein